MAVMRDGCPVIPDTREADLINLEYASSADLVLFLAGNQFMVMGELLAAFQTRHPEVERVFCETLPPRLELEQILAGGAWYRGELITATPDLYASVSQEGVDRLAAAGKTDPGQCVVYLHNRLSIMVPAGNPKNICSVADLGRAGVRVSQPSPEYEDIAWHIMNMYRDAGGEELLQRIMEEKSASGETMLTTVHHRETPERLLAGQADAGPVWATEVGNAQRQGWALEAVEPGQSLDQRHRVDYTLCPVAGSANFSNAAAFAAFITSREAQDVFARYGFTPKF